MKKSNFAQKTLIRNRISDIEYIEMLEMQISEMDNRIEQFIEVMDNAVFSRESLAVLNAYVENLKLLRL